MPRRSPTLQSIAVVGGGPVGLASAIALTQAGFRVTVFDCATPPIDKACGEGLLPDCLPLLSRLGVELAGLGHRFSGIGFSSGSGSVSAGFPAGAALGMRRTVLHSLLADSAEDLGVTLRWGAKAVHLHPVGISAGGVTQPFDFVVAADGQNSQIRKQAGLHQPRHERKRFGFRKHYRVAPWSPFVEIYWGPRYQLYVTPVAPDEVSLALLSSDPALRIEPALAGFPNLRARLDPALSVTREKGALTVSRTLPTVHTERVALVGDASGSVDAITGEGLDLGFKQAFALAEALSAGNLPAYGAAHRRLASTPRSMSSLLLSLATHPALQRRALTALNRHPDFFSSLLRVHVGASSFPDLLSWRLLGLCREFLVS